MTRSIRWGSPGQRPRVAFFGRKPGGAAALRLLHRLGWDVATVVVPDTEDKESDWLPLPQVREVAAETGLQVTTQAELSASIHTRALDRPDFLVSYLYPHRVTSDMLRFPKIAAINFHPGPLPQLGGWGQYIYAILAANRSHGVACHLMTESFDRGPLVARREFPMDPPNETALSLEQKAQCELLVLFYDVCQRIMEGDPLELDARPLERYVSRADVEPLRAIPEGCSPHEACARARAFWYPPYPGAYHARLGPDLTVMPPQALHSAGRDTHRSDFDKLWSLCSQLLGGTSG